MSQKLLEGLTLQASRIDDDGRYNYEAFIRVDGQTGGARVIERAEDQSLAPTKELRKAEIERALRLLRHIPRGSPQSVTNSVRPPFGSTRHAFLDHN